jgi:hypothetical protein
MKRDRIAGGERTGDLTVSIGEFLFIQRLLFASGKPGARSTLASKRWEMSPYL